jgi:hypothetical protein
MNSKKYNIDLCKGTGLIQESLLLLNLYSLNMSKSEMTIKAIESNLLVKSSNKRIKDIVEVAFYKRFVSDDSKIPIYLRTALSKNLSLEVITQLFFIYTSRSNQILMDFINDVYWPEVIKGTLEMDSKLSRKFILETIRHSDYITGWSESTQRKVASYLISAIVDFKLLDNQRKVKSVFLHDITANYLAHELHFRGFSDNAIVNSDDWKLFGYSKFDTAKHLERLSFQGNFIFQNSGEIVKIDWIYKTMEEFTNAIK